jgi:hypothetical protein
MTVHPNQALLQELLADGFPSPEREYDARTEDFVAEIPQTGECMIRDQLYQRQHAFDTRPQATLRGLSGEGEHWAAELAIDYGNQQSLAVVLVEFRGGRIAHETRYYAIPDT